jgi:hypothetical protein
MHELRTRLAECERERDDLRAQVDEHRSFCDEMTESLVDMTIDASTTALERDAAIQRAERAESDRLAEVEGLTAERDHYRVALLDAAGCARAAQACQPLIVAAEAWAQHHERLRDAGADYHGTEQDLLEAVHGLRLARSVAPQPVSKELV